MKKMGMKQAMLGVAVGAALALTGCGSTGSGYTGAGVGPSMVGPTSQALGSSKPVYAYNKEVYLDVVIPVLDPGLPKTSDGYIDDEELVEENIWPEVRRLESKRFAINMRNSLEETKSFNSVRVVPTPSSAGDLYVVSKIKESNTMETEIGISVIDATNTVWAEKDFEITASSGFYRDSRNHGKDPNRHIYTDIAKWVYGLIQAKTAQDLENVKLVADMRYAAMYSPEAFSGYLTEKRSRRAGTVVSVNGLPADTDVMLQRVREFEAQDMAFIDGLQESYDVFYQETDEVYRNYQRESLPIREKIAEEERERNTKAGIGIALGLAAILTGRNSNSTSGAVGTAVAATAATAAFRGAMRDHEALTEYTSVFDEVGQNLDLQVAPQVRTFEDKEIELTGTASEQYAQWRAHLIEVYEENETPTTQL